MRTPILTLSLLLAAVPACSVFRPFSKYSPKETPTESERLDRFFEDAFLTRLDRSPMLRARLGANPGGGSGGEWDDLSEAHAVENFEIAQHDLARLREEFEYDELDDARKLSYRLFEFETERTLARFPWRHHDYPVNQNAGVHTETVSFLIDVHAMESLQDARDYITRLAGIRERFDALEEGLRLRESKGIVPPAFVFEKVISDCRNILRGEPFALSGVDSPLWGDFTRKLLALPNVSPEEKERLMESARAELLGAVRPAYESLVRLLESLAERHAAPAEGSLAARADLDASGVWRLPEGDALYAHLLKEHTTTELTAQAIHLMGLEEVTRIHAEMRVILREVDFAGDIEAFFEYLRVDERFFFPNDAQGRAAYLARARAIIAAAEERLGDVCPLPAAGLEVRPVEAFREQSAGKAFYSPGAPDGSLPAIYYANLSDMGSMPIYQMEALAYHETIPGHHLQITLARAALDLPRFRRFSYYTVYGEGWALYAESLARELDLYSDAYSDFGRLAMELWRAARLVVDTGLHHGRWTRTHAIDYLVRNTPNPRGDCERAVERYLVAPGQATAYQIGLMGFRELRRTAEEELGEHFDLRSFHGAILGEGPLPLPSLREVAADWIASELEARE